MATKFKPGDRVRSTFAARYVGTVRRVVSEATEAQYARYEVDFDRLAQLAAAEGMELPAQGTYEWEPNLELAEPV